MVVCISCGREIDPLNLNGGTVYYHMSYVNSPIGHNYGGLADAYECAECTKAKVEANEQ